MADIERILSELLDGQTELVMRVAEYERRMDNTLRHGKVTDVDPEKHLARIEIGERDGTVLKSAWLPYGQIAGDYKQHRPPTVGQQMTMFAPNGEIRQAVIMPFTWSDEQKAPSDKGDEHVTTYGDKYRQREKKDLREFTLDKVKQVISPEKITTSINGGNTPKDGNGAKADDGDGSNDQADAGSSIVQEEKKITHKIGSTSIVQDEKTVTIEAVEKILLKVGGSEIELTPALIAQIAEANVIAGPTFTGMTSKTDQDGPRVMTQSGPALQHKSKA